MKYRELKDGQLDAGLSLFGNNVMQVTSGTNTAMPSAERREGRCALSSLTSTDLRAFPTTVYTFLWHAARLTLVRHARLNDIQGGLIFTQVIGHVPIRVHGQ